ncbi:MAG TPA: hypothetical protein VN442_08130 [Bryobacteraceae bacterium]|nr:hypothetical protein [Bryobacteraceae bacterium]
MRLCFGLLVCIVAAPTCALAGEDAGMARAKAQIEKLDALVKAGAVPRAQLERAERELADAADADFLRRTLYGPDLTEEQTDAMIDAAGRRLGRRRQALQEARRLVAEGVASQLSLTTHLEDLDRSRKEFDLAESRARLCRELTAMARLEQEVALRPETSRGLVDRFDGTSFFSAAELGQLESAFQGRFGRPLPVSALGDTAVHRSMGFDHRDRVDVAVHPDQPEGVWLRQYLEIERIPYFAFRHAVRGKATGAHIHIGPASHRLARSAGDAVGGS